MVIISTGGVSNGGGGLIPVGAFVPIVANGNGNNSIVYVDDVVVSSVGEMVITNLGSVLMGRQQKTSIVPAFLLSSSGDIIMGWENY